MFALSDEIVNNQQVSFFSYNTHIMTDTESLARALGKKHSTVLQQVGKLKDNIQKGVIKKYPDVDALLLDETVFISYSFALSSKKDLDICKEYLQAFYSMQDKNKELQQQPMVQLCNLIGEDAFEEVARLENHKDATLEEMLYLLDNTPITVNIQETIRKVRIDYIINRDSTKLKTEKDKQEDFTTFCKESYYELITDALINGDLTPIQAHQYLKTADDLWVLKKETEADITALDDIIS